MENLWAKNIVRKKLNKLLVITISLTWGSQAFSKEPSFSTSTKYSKTVIELQSKFHTSFKNIQILVIDQDWLLLEASKKLATSVRSKEIISKSQLQSLREKVYGQLVKRFVEQKSEHSLSQAAVDNLGRLFAAGASHAVRISKSDLLDRRTGSAIDGPQEICVIAGRKVNEDADQQIRNMSGLDRALVGEVANSSLKSPLDYETMNMFSDFHEIGHCLDEKYIPRVLAAANEHRGAEDEVLYFHHQSEVFAEIFAALMMTQLGRRNFILKRANYRLMATAIQGHHTAKMDPAYSEHYLGYVYALHRGLFETHKHLATQSISHSSFSHSSLEKLIHLGHQLTEKGAFGIEDQHAFTYFLENKLSTPNWDRLQHEFPHLKYSFAQAQELKQDIAKAFHQELETSLSPQQLIKAIQDNLTDGIPIANEERDFSMQIKRHTNGLLDKMAPTLKESQVISQDLDNLREPISRRMTEKNKEEILQARMLLRHYPTILKKIFQEMNHNRKKSEEQNFTPKTTTSLTSVHN